MLSARAYIRLPMTALLAIRAIGFADANRNRTFPFRIDFQLRNIQQFAKRLALFLRLN